MTVSLFGEFSISDGVNTVTEDDIHSDMVTKLFAYLMSQKRLGSTAQELADAFWPEESSDNPAGALKNLMYRLRKTLEKTWPEEKLFKTGRGSYQWNPAIPVKIDVNEMESLIARARDSEEEDEKIRLLRKAVGLYKGKFLADFSNEYWVMSIQAFEHSQYLNAVKTLCELLYQQDMFSVMEEVSLKATTIDPLDEDLHCILMRAYIGENKQNMAQTHYKDAVKLLYDNLGVEPSDEMKSIYEDALRQVHSQEADLETIQEELKKGDAAGGAFYCEYGVFRKIYELESRRAGRMGMSIFLSLVTLNVTQKPKVRQTDLEVKGIAMDQMKEILLGCLRSGDMITRYSSNQFLVMLQGCDYENAKLVMSRINNNYYELHKHVKAAIQYSLKEMEL